MTNDAEFKIQLQHTMCNQRVSLNSPWKALELLLEIPLN